MTGPAELRLRIDRGPTSGTYNVLASGPGGDAVGSFTNPFSDLELENFVLKMGKKRGGVRRIDSPETQATKDFGGKLFAALFDDRVRDIYVKSVECTKAGQPLRVTLSLTGSPELMQIPWEYLYDRPDFLGRSTLTPIVRYLDLSESRRALEIALPLRILGVVASPLDYPHLDVETEKKKVTTALGPMIESGALTIDWLAKPNLPALGRQLRKAEYHVFHFIGHGGFDKDAEDGVLLFVNEETGDSDRISGAELGDMLHDETSLRLAVLNACEGARAAVDDPFAGVATSLIEREVPAVIGMQFEITDRAAIIFSSEFYAALADGMPVDTAIAEARKMIYADKNQTEWGTPVLFMRVQDGRLFDVAAHSPVVRTPRDVLLQTAVHAGLRVNDDEPRPRIGWWSRPQTFVQALSSGRARLLAGFVAMAAVVTVVLLALVIIRGGPEVAEGSTVETPPAETASPTPPPDVPILVPDVFRMPAEEADAAIREAGFTDIRTEFVCSNTVPTAGLVRQVLVNIDDPDGTPSIPENELVGIDGSIREVPPSTRLHVKVANGQPC
jgi:hypothetical protein